MSMRAEKNEKNTNKIFACLVIDDPLLRPNYGCLDYEKLLEEMNIHNFFTEIAFIPWNYKRSNMNTIHLFTDNTDRYAICVHGCNHTANEFGIGDYHRVKELSLSALIRMEEHQRLTGLPYDPIMVFPQGRFSTVAIKAIKDVGFRAAFNSTLEPLDGRRPPSIEYEQPATTMFHEFPLFLRRYPEDKLGFSRDVALGRPIIIVEHPSVFKDGYNIITDLVDWINTLGNVEWKPLSYIVDHYYGQAETSLSQNECCSIQRKEKIEIRIALRRYASEFRDNYIERNNVLNRIYRFCRRFL